MIRPCDLDANLAPCASFVAVSQNVTDHSPKPPKDSISSMDVSKRMNFLETALGDLKDSSHPVLTKRMLQ